jgi:hypothetical protein
VGYLHIDNLYKPEAQGILLFRECYALEKIHGTSAHVRWDGMGGVRLFSGGEKPDAFAALFDTTALALAFTEKCGTRDVTVYGEAYGGKCQGMRATYGERLRFVAFDVRSGDWWLDVPSAEGLIVGLGLEFVAYSRIPTDLAAIDAERDRPSEQAKRNGIAEPKIREGVVLRPPVEVTTNGGNRIIAKHKRAEFLETKTMREVDPAQRVVLEAAEKIAEEWVTEMRLTHVLDRLGNPTDLSATGKVIAAMVEDVCREASGEIVDSKEARKAIGAAAARLFKRRVTTVVRS